jgi:CheY-like chemotaxis protein
MMNKELFHQLMAKELHHSILVVEATRMAAKVAERIFAQCGFRVVHADCGYKALLETLLHDFDLIVVGLQLLGLSGVELAKAIRRNSSRNQYTRIIALTADFTPQKEQACLEAGIERLLEKPLTRAVARAIVPKQRDLKAVSEGVEGEE